MNKISVVMPVYNGGIYLSEAIESILNQTFNNFEFIIINDGSTDNSLKIIKSYIDDRIIVINQKNQGLVKSLNNGIRKSKYEFIARMDADDISKKDRFKEQVNFLNNYPNAALVGSQAEIISEDGKYLYISELPHSKEKITEYLKTASPFFHGSVMIRKEILINVGCYDENVIHFVEDLILWKRLNLNNDMYNINKPLYKYRLRYNALSNRPKNLELKMVRLCDLITSEDQTDKLQYHYNELNNLFKKIKKISKKKLQSLYYQKLGRIYLTKNIHLSEAKINLNKSIQYSIFNLHAYYYILIYYIKKIKDSK